MERETRMSELVTRLAKVRAGRVRPQWQAVVSGEVEKLRQELAKRVKASAEVAEAWRDLAPEELRDHAWPTGVLRGTLRIEVENPAFRYKLERWLKSGGRAMLLERCSASVRRVKVELTEGGDQTAGTRRTP